MNGDPVSAVPCFTDPASAALCYEDELGWSVGHGSMQVWLAARYEIEALTMPERLGRVVLSRLYTPCPVIRSPGPPVRWVLLTRPLEVARQRWGPPPSVGYIWGNAMIWLPPSQWGEEPLSWATPPASSLPAFKVLSGVLDRAVADHGG